MYLIARRGKMIPVDSIQEAIWPEGEYPDNERCIKNLVYRLRNKIDVDETRSRGSSVICSNGSYRWNRDISYWLDVEAFETLCIEAHNLVEREPELAAQKYQEAVCLYSGEYLPEFTSSEWIIPIRNYYHQLFLRSVIELLELHREARQYSEIRKICEKIFLIERFDEVLHLRYLEALLKEGKTAQASAHYQYITSLLYREFGVKPSSAMKQIYRSIKSNRDKPELNFSDIRELMSDRESTDGAMFCDADSFDLFCNLEKRRAKREGTYLFIASLTLTGHDFQMPPTAELFAAMEELKQALFGNMRKGDVFSQWNESQFVILLSTMSLEQAETILQRIRKEFKTVLPKGMIIPRSTVYPISSPENI